MELTSVKIEGFRNIESDQIRFGDNITSLVSVNSYGKSNLLAAIDFAIDFINASPRRKNQLMQHTSGIPLNRKIDSRDFLAEFVFLTDFDDKQCYVKYGFSFTWVKNQGGKKISGEWLSIKEVGKSKKSERLINREEKPLFKSSPTGRCSKVVNVNDNELIINKLIGVDKLYYLNIVEQINHIKIHVDRHLDASDLYSQRIRIIDPSDADDQETFDFHGVTDIPRLVYRLKSKNPAYYDILVDTFMQLFPNIISVTLHEIDTAIDDSLFQKDIPFTIDNKVYSIFVTDRNLNQPLDFKTMSDGAKRVFLMLTFTIIANIKNYHLIAFEEPENSIHPSLLQSYLSVLSQLVGNCKIIVTSHSPYILQYVNTSDIYIGKPNEMGLASFAKIDEKRVNALLKDATDSGESVGNYIFDLLSGGEDDTDILLSYLEK